MLLLLSRAGVWSAACPQLVAAALPSLVPVLLLQSLVLAPLFVWFEVLFALGLYRGLHREVSDRVAANIQAFRANGKKAA